MAIEKLLEQQKTLKNKLTTLKALASSDGLHLRNGINYLFVIQNMGDKAVDLIERALQAELDEVQEQLQGIQRKLDAVNELLS